MRIQQIRRMGGGTCASKQDDPPTTGTNVNNADKIRLLKCIKLHLIIINTMSYINSTNNMGLNDRLRICPGKLIRSELPCEIV